MTKNTDQEDRHTVLLGFWPNGNSDNPTAFNSKIFNENPATMHYKTTVSKLKLLANLKSVTHPGPFPLNQRHINTFEIQEKAKAKSNRVLSYAIDYASADNLPACINRLNQNSKPW